MVFTTTNLFKGIQCPQGECCTLTNCIFAHDLRPQFTPQVAKSPERQHASITPKDDTTEPPSKRRRVMYNNLSDKPLSKADLIRLDLAQSKTAAPAKVTPSSSGDHKPKPLVPSTLAAPVSPPPANSKATSSAANKTSIDNNNKTSTSTLATKPTTPQQKKIELNPRLIPNDPAGHAKRSIYLKALHDEMVRLNKQLVERTDVQYKVGLTLLEHELIQLAIDEEERFAREHGTVYGNVVKNRIAAYRKMKPDDWIVHIKGTPIFAQKQAPPTKPRGVDAPKVIETGLSPAEEVAVAMQLVVPDQLALAKHGYIPVPPTPEQAAEAAAAVETSQNYEICDRCTARFQVYPHRNEEGLLTSAGKCRHHPNRKIFPQRTKADTGPKEPIHPCCGEAVGTPGCTELPNHVFKASSPARLAAVMPFIVTPENDHPAKDRYGRKVKAVAFDCEMGYTTMGMELIRLTAVSWPEGEELADVLVRPFGIVLDLNSRFSGVSPEDMARAVPPPPKSPLPLPQLDGAADDPPPPPMTIVESPYKARELLCSFLTPTTPLIGHAIDNDLNVVRLCHPTIIDTVVTYPHPRGLPLRYGLKMLCARHLGLAIQQGGDRGHDSLEDSRATGDLVRMKVADKWKILRAEGWKFVGGSLVPPHHLSQGVLEARAEMDSGLAERMVENAFNGGKKRRKRGSGGDSGGEEVANGDGNGLKSFLDRKKVGGGQAEHELSVSYLEDETLGLDK
ncbi:RNA exonuclease 3 [Elasticomyces elasticus]|nr:RNA exonuclease 3 [Elasticomyces elasticus]KAK3663834.1 RNA exonuclease 3 [Elasticomyces elasticus]KAK4923957.1 RNA exonuclease 3 [Elasticomyces elasticus]KAK5762166.1 RNA exonuclease 3 [Elasticomyces elasticus]